jgi:two-component system, sporulation sensor kinase D
MPMPILKLSCPFQIIQNATIPIILTDKDSIINTLNIDEKILKDKKQLKKSTSKIKKTKTIP